MRLFISLILLKVPVVLGFAFSFSFLIFPSTIVSSKFMDELYIQLIILSFI